MRKKEVNAFKAKVDKDAAALVEHICEYSIQRICRRRVTCAMPESSYLFLCYPLGAAYLGQPQSLMRAQRDTGWNASSGAGRA